MKPSMERQIDRARRDYHYGHKNEEQLVRQVIGAGREESERHGLLKRVRQVLGKDQQAV